MDFLVSAAETRRNERSGAGATIGALCRRCGRHCGGRCERRARCRAACVYIHLIDALSAGGPGAASARGNHWRKSRAQSSHKQAEVGAGRNGLYISVELTKTNGSSMSIT